MAEDRLLEPLQCLARFDAEVVDERVTRLRVGVERISLPARAVERQHLLCAQPFPQGMLPHEHVQLSERRSLRPSARSQSILSMSTASRRSSSRATSSRPRDSSCSPASVGPRQSESASW